MTAHITHRPCTYAECGLSFSLIFLPRLSGRTRNRGLTSIADYPFVAFAGLCARCDNNCSELCVSFRYCSSPWLYSIEMPYVMSAGRNRAQAFCVCTVHVSANKATPFLRCRCRNGVFPFFSFHALTVETAELKGRATIHQDIYSCTGTLRFVPVW